MVNIDAVIFDLGGVLTQPQKSDKIDELRALLGTGLDREAFREAYSKPRLDYDRGTIDADSYWRRVAEAAGSGNGSSHGGPLWPALRGKLTRVDIEGWFEIRPGMIELARRLKAGIGRVAILSNINRECADHLDSGYDWLGLFDVRVYSCDHLILKPERGIFDLCVGRLGLSADRCLFIDDIEANVEGARRAGLHGIRFIDEGDLVGKLAGFAGTAH